MRCDAVRAQRSRGSQFLWSFETKIAAAQVLRKLPVGLGRTVPLQGMFHKSGGPTQRLAQSALTRSGSTLGAAAVGITWLESAGDGWFLQQKPCRCSSSKW